MRRTFITRLPNKAGAFLKATRIVAQSGANITRVSYNKAVDLHVLFLEVSGSQAQLDTIAVRLNDVGYILNEDNPGKTNFAGIPPAERTERRAARFGAHRQL